MGESHLLINYSKLEAIAKDNKEFLLEVTLSYIQLINEFSKDYGKAATGLDTKFLQDVTHRVKGSLRFMEAQKLLAAVAEFKAEFYAGTQTAESAHTSIGEVTDICNQILEILEEKRSQLE